MLAAILGMLSFGIFYESSFAQKDWSPLQQWKKFADPDMLSCNEKYLLLQKDNGYPACVSISTYFKLIERGYGKFDFTLLGNHPEMINQIIDKILNEQKLTHHWHEMMMKNPVILTETLETWNVKMKENPILLRNMLGPMTSEPILREDLVTIMKNHSEMENALKQNDRWMISVHHPIGKSHGCEWCADHKIKQKYDFSHDGTNSDKMTILIHQLWVNTSTSKQINERMLESPTHLAAMSQQLMEPMVNSIMNDQVLRQEMINLMLENHDFMNSIRHENPVNDQH